VRECTWWWAACCVAITIDFRVAQFWIIENVLEPWLYWRRNGLHFLPLDEMGRSSDVVIDVFGKRRGTRYS